MAALLGSLLLPAKLFVRRTEKGTNHSECVRDKASDHRIVFYNYWQLDAAQRADSVTDLSRTDSGCFPPDRLQACRAFGVHHCVIDGLV